MLLFALIGGALPPRAAVAQTPSVEVALTTDSSSIAASEAYPNTSWTQTPYENTSTYPADDDWTLADATITFYVVPAPGASFGAVDLTVQWDEAKLALAEATAGNAPSGLFAGSGGFFEADPLGDPGRVVINASRLDNQNATAQSGDYIARLTFTLTSPGEATLGLSGLDVRAYDGAGGQSDVPATATNGKVVAYLGDVASPGDNTTGDGIIDINDLSIFSPAYFSGVMGHPNGLDDYKMKFDIGPTSSGTVFGTPQLDTEIDLADLAIFSTRYGL